MPFDSLQHIGKAGDVQKSGSGILSRCLHQDMIRLVGTQHVVDQVGGDRHLPA